MNPMVNQQIQQKVPHVVDLVAVGSAASLTWVAAIPQVLASLVSLAALVWYAIRFYGIWKEYKAKKNEKISD